MEQKKKKHLLLWSCSSIVFLALSIGCFFTAGFVKDSTYQECISISSATERNLRLETYRRAIRICPERADAYLLLLDAYSEDGTFDKVESEEWLSIYNTNHNRLPQNESVADIYTQAGLLYVNGYEDTATTSLRMALPFFEEALPLMTPNNPDYQACACYTRIGQYYRDYIWTTAAKEVSPGKMETLLSDIETTLTELSSSTGADAPYNYLGFSNAVCNLLYGQRDILAATVQEQAVIGILDQIYEEMPDIERLQSARTKEMANTLTANRGLYYDMISRAYERNGGK